MLNSFKTLNNKQCGIYEELQIITLCETGQEPNTHVVKVLLPNIISTISKFTPICKSFLTGRRRHFLI